MSVIDEYLADFEGVTRERLEAVRGAIRAEVPEGQEVLSYAIPTFDLNGRHVIHFAGFKNHIGLYPTPQGVEDFADELSAYPQGKGSVQFPHDQPLPLGLIRRIAGHMRAQVLSKPAKKTKPRA